MEIVDKELKRKVNRRIKTVGVRKAYLAKLMGLDAVRFSQTMAGKRKIQPKELRVLVAYLSIDLEAHLMKLNEVKV